MSILTEVSLLRDVAIRAPCMNAHVRGFGFAPKLHRDHLRVVEAGRVTEPINNRLPACDGANFCHAIGVSAVSESGKQCPQQAKADGSRGPWRRREPQRSSVVVCGDGTACLR